MSALLTLATSLNYIVVDDAIAECFFETLQYSTAYVGSMAEFITISKRLQTMRLLETLQQKRVKTVTMLRKWTIFGVVGTPFVNFDFLITTIYLPKHLNAKNLVNGYNMILET
uniref:G protein-coupled receptor n=1 Tax=Panagrellus redivivus TaxID=6233 RepID=A0A7E4WAR1_PANRE